MEAGALFMSIMSKDLERDAGCSTNEGSEQGLLSLTSDRIYRYTVCNEQVIAPGAGRCVPHTTFVHIEKCWQQLRVLLRRWWGGSKRRRHERCWTHPSNE